MKLLGELSPDDILIIDNVDSESKEISELLDDGYRALCRLSLHLIITSRTRCEGYGIEVGELKRIQLYELMERFVKINRNEMDALIDTVEAHTLTVELIARTLKYGCISVEKLLERLKYGNLDSENFIRVAVRKDRDERKKRIEEHLQCLFQIADLPEIEQNYMKNALLISNEGMDYWIFAEMLIDFEQDNMQHLIDRGWIREQGGVLWLHSLVQYVGRKQWPITFNIADSFLAKGFKLAEIIAENADDTNRFDNSWEISQIILSYLTALNYSNVKEGEKLYEKYGSVCQRVIQKKAYLLLLASSEDIGDPMENEYTDTEGVHFSLIEDRTVSYVIYEIKKYLKYPSLVYEYGVELLESTTGTIKGKNFRTFYLDHPRKNGNQLLILTYECSTNIMYINRALLIDGEVRRSFKTNVMHLVDEKFKVISNLAENGNNLSNIWDIDEENIEKEIGKSIQLIDPTKMEIPLNSIDEMVKGHTYFAFWIGGEKEKCTDSLTIAEHFENGYNGFPKNPEKARSYYEKAIEEGKVNSIYDLGCNYYYGREGYDEDKKHALSLITMAAEYKQTDAMVFMANRYINGDVCEQNYEYAYSLLKEATSIGDIVATNNLGWMCLYGYGCEQSISRAIELFLRAANNEIEPVKSANRHLGKLYLGVHPAVSDDEIIDFEKALYYLEKAKQLGADDVDELIERARKC